MSTSMLPKQDMFLKASAYSLAYLDAKNVFNVSFVMINGQDQVSYIIEDVRI
jgi:hypothetical protein